MSRTLNRMLNRLNNVRFRHKLVISYLVIIIIPLIVLGTYAYYQARQFLFERTTQGLNDAVNKVAANIDYQMKRYDTIITFMTNSPQMLQIVNNQDASYFDQYVQLSQELEPLMSTIKLLNEDLTSIVIYTGNPAITERTDSLQRIGRLADRPWYPDVMKDFKVHWMLENGELVGANRFMQLEADATPSLLYVKLDYANIFRDVAVDKMSQYGIFITDSHNRLIYSQNKTGRTDLEAVATDPARQQNGRLRIGGIDYLLIASIIEEPGWTLTYFAPVQQMAYDAGSIGWATLIVALGCLVILLVMVWGFSRTFVKQILHLNRLMRMVEFGNLDIEVTTESKDEIGQLTNRFGAMLRQVNLLIQEVYRSKIEQKEAELRSLQSKINPHFLYNTLSFINWKAIDIDAIEISRLTVELSRYYRTVLNRGKSFITLENELDNTRAYIGIQNVMHNHCFDVEYRIDPAIFPFHTINVILQPVVENAIVHGIDKKTDGRGKIVVSGEQREQGIELSVEDNGPGMAPETARLVLSDRSPGYGIRNVQERIQAFFGEGYGVTIRSEAGCGTCVTLTVPKYKEEETA